MKFPLLFLCGTVCCTMVHAQRLDVEHYTNDARWIQPTLFSPTQVGNEGGLRLNSATVHTHGTQGDFGSWAWVNSADFQVQSLHTGFGIQHVYGSHHDGHGHRISLMASPKIPVKNWTLMPAVQATWGRADVIEGPFPQEGGMVGYDILSSDELWFNGAFAAQNEHWFLQVQMRQINRMEEYDPLDHADLMVARKFDLGEQLEVSPLVLLGSFGDVSLGSQVRWDRVAAGARYEFRDREVGGNLGYTFHGFSCNAFYGYHFGNPSSLDIDYTSFGIGLQYVIRGKKERNPLSFF